MANFEILRNSDSDKVVKNSPQKNDERLASQQQNKPDGIYTKWVQDWWLLEIVALLLGTVAIVAIVIVLKHYNNKPAPTFNSILGHNITINTLISILSTIGRVALLYPVAECVSQQKWFWFSTARPLTDIETFDKGSRGAFGSLMLIWRVNVKQFASIGAIILVFGLAVDPLSQQLLHFELHRIPDPSGIANVATGLMWATYNQYDNYLPFGVSNDDVLDQVTDPPLYMKAAILNGLFTTGSNISDIQPFCSTGNCTWPVYRSLAVCMRSQDVTAHLKKSEHQYPHYTATRWSLTSRSYIETAAQDPSCVLNMSSVAQSTPAKDDASTSNNLVFNDTIAFADSPNPIADVYVIYANTTQSNCTTGPCPYPVYDGEICRNCTGNDPLAVEFVLEWCVAEYNTSVINGTTITARQDSTNNFTNPNGNDDITGPIFNTTTEFPYTKAFDSPPNYSVDHPSHYMLSNYLRKTLNGSVYLEQFGHTTLLKTSDAAETFWQRFNPNSGISEQQDEAQNVTGVNGILRNIATSMTNIVRDTNYTGSDTPAGYLTAVGTAWREQNFVHVQWGWIAAPIALNFLSLVFVLITIAQTTGKANKSKIWKSSSISTLLALGESLHREVGGLQSLSKNEYTLQDTKATLKRSLDGDWMLQSSISNS